VGDIGGSYSEDFGALECPCFSSQTTATKDSAGDIAAKEKAIKITLVCNPCAKACSYFLAFTLQKVNILNKEFQS